MFLEWIQVATTAIGLKSANCRCSARRLENSWVPSSTLSQRARLRIPQWISLTIPITEWLQNTPGPLPVQCEPERAEHEMVDTVLWWRRILDKPLGHSLSQPLCVRHTETSMSLTGNERSNHKYWSFVTALFGKEWKIVMLVKLRKYGVSEWVLDVKQICVHVCMFDVSIPWSLPGTSKTKCCLVLATSPW